MTIDIDGSIGEGGGQILRSSVALSIVTGKACRVRNIRAGREKPGLLRQHLTAILAAAEVCGARTDGVAIGSKELSFDPGPVRGGSYRFSVGTAGSTSLVLQTILPALMTAPEPSEIVLEGGTHNPFAPPFDFLERAFAPVLGTIGPRLTLVLERPGFFPAGGGIIRAGVEPSPLGRIEIASRGEVTGRRALSRVSNLNGMIARRELGVVRSRLGWADECLKIEQVQGALGPGNVLTLEVASENVTELFTGFGRREVSAEAVAESVVKEVEAYLESEAPVGPYLADQLLLPMALAGGGRFITVKPTSHTLTNIEIIRAFLDVDIVVEQRARTQWTIDLKGRT